MNSIILETFRRPFPSSLKPRRKAQTIASKTLAADGKFAQKSRLWRLTSPIEQRLEISLFLILSLAGIGATIYSIYQLLAFIQSDALAHAMTALRVSF
jgi:hypothetical protein